MDRTTRPNSPRPTAPPPPAARGRPAGAGERTHPRVAPWEWPELEELADAGRLRALRRRLGSRAEALQFYAERFHARHGGAGPRGAPCDLCNAAPGEAVLRLDYAAPPDGAEINSRNVLMLLLMIPLDAVLLFTGLLARPERRVGLPIRRRLCRRCRRRFGWRSAMYLPAVMAAWGSLLIGFCVTIFGAMEAYKPVATTATVGIGLTALGVLLLAAGGWIAVWALRLNVPKPLLETRPARPFRLEGWEDEP